MRLHVGFVCVVGFLLVCFPPTSSCLQYLPEGSVGIRFLVTVNDTWDPDGCMATVVTPMLISGKEYNESGQIQVGSCDHGPLVFNVQKGSDDGVSKMQVDLTFHSSVIEDASPPACQIPWNGSYLDPPSPSPLPACFVMDSREGYHMTYYWFRLLEWQFG
ncbi:hypothetical protein BaRGS_00034631 [Batillaria attramentaria]|uniref:Uncharacterized protein n=1 Tax=Batillaria attramentaria TaxID=370345 RepID=A0ABD0JGU9_9CAEN